MSEDLIHVEAVVALADLAGRSGATEFEIGYQYDETDPEFVEYGALYYCSARYRGARLIVDEQATPGHAADGLAHRILDGGSCTHCGEMTSTRDTDLGIYVRFGRSRKARCIWWRDGERWKRGCE